MKQQPNAAARVRKRLREWADREGHGSRKRIAKAVSSAFGTTKSPSWVTDILRGDPMEGGNELRLRDLDPIARLMKVGPGELVAYEDSEVLEVSANEKKLIVYFRSLPHSIQRDMMSYLDYLHAAHERELKEIERERRRVTREMGEAHRKGIA